MESRSFESRSLRYAPFALPVPRERAKLIPEGAADPPADDDFPLIEQFLDELPSIEDYLDAAPVPAEVAQSPVESSVDPDPEGWAVAGWQSYAWDSLSSLARPKRNRATPEEAWNPEPWPASFETGSGPTPDDVAAALDDIAQRIRAGELPIDQFRASPPEAAMAAVVAAMLRLQG